ncbi:MAG: erythromycin esterase family protein, partial [Verrucomicrobia bacterium]|nr:erythromycin esterase family protein [Cytophagales bacterium]
NVLEEKIICIKDSSFSSLALLEKSIGDARIVMLGEQTHYDGTTFSAKIHLIKFLHEKMGFNVIAFEGDMYGLHKANEEVKNKMNVFHAMRKAIFSQWSESLEFQSFNNYLEANSSLILTGFDCQLTSAYTKDYLVTELKELLFLDKQGLWKEDDFYLLESLITELAEGDLKNFANSPQDSLHFYSLIHKVEVSLHHIEVNFKPLAKKVSFWKQWLKSTLACLQYTINEEQKGKKSPVQNPRDAIMADNLIFLSNHYPNEKIIVWAASYHITNQLDALDWDNPITDTILQTMGSEQEEDKVSLKTLLAGAVPMGQCLKKAGKATYSIGFIAQKGEYGRKGDTNMVFSVPFPPPASIENAFHHKGCKSGFILLNTLPTTAYFSSPLGYLPIKANWQNIFDCFFFSDTMYPITPFIDSTDLLKKR